MNIIMNKKLILVITFITCLLVAVNAQKKTVVTYPDNATIFLNGVEVGSGQYTVKFKRSEDFVNVKVQAVGYIDKTFTLLKRQPEKTIYYKLYEDEAYNNSVAASSGVDLANKGFTITCRPGLDAGAVWKRLMSTAIKHFENIEIRDQSAGWIRTAWVNTAYTYQIVRTRLEIREQFADEGQLSYLVIISSEIAPREMGLTDEDFVEYSRVLRIYETIISELQISLGGNY